MAAVVFRTVHLHTQSWVAKVEGLRQRFRAGRQADALSAASTPPPLVRRGVMAHGGKVLSG